AARPGSAYVPFDDHADYLRYLDGKPRREGILSFLKARALALPDSEIQSLEGTKFHVFGRLLNEQGVQTYPSTIRLIQEARQRGIKLALVTSSRRGREILAKAGLIGDFDLILDGTDIEHLDLAGKPDPAMF